MGIQRLEDKIKLATELKLTGLLDIYKKEVEDATDLKFNKINDKEIYHKLIGNYNLRWNMTIGVLIGIVILAIMYTTRFFLENTDQTQLLVASMLLLGFYLGRFFYNKRLRISHMEINKWEHDIPYGALLAVAEARSKGYTNFNIHYPITVRSYERFISDPIITGLSPAGSRREIFFWDDRNIHDLDGSIIGKK